MKLLFVLTVLALILAIAKTWALTFRAQSPDDYASTTPKFDLRRHLSGEILSEGLIYGPTGKLAASFVATMTGKWDGDTGSLREEFTYSTGGTQSREWQLKLGPGNSFTATAADIIGVGTGEISGSTARLSYQIVLPESAGGHQLDVIDWLYLTDNGTIMNKSEMRKFGFKVGELVATMRQAQ